MMESQPSGPGTDYALVVCREDGVWEVGVLPERLTGDLDGLLSALRQQPDAQGCICFVNVSDDFFIALRTAGDGARLLLSDRTAAVAWDLAKQVTDRLELPVLDDEQDVEEVWPAGDMSIFTDLGLDEMELGAILADVDADADEMLLAIAERLGFDQPFARALDAAVR